MVVNKNKRNALILILSLPLISFAQTKEITLQVRDKKIEEILDLLKSNYKTYFSYDPAIFISEPERSINVRKVKLNDVLKQILSPKYNFVIVGEYVVITVRKGKPPETAIKSESQKKMVVSSSIVTDTIFIEKVITKYDTQRVTIHVYDTIFVKEVRMVYDTISIAKITKKVVSLIPSLEFFRWTHSSNDLGAIAYNGISGKVDVEFPLRKFVVSAGVGYNHLFQNFSYNRQIENIGFVIDSISVGVGLDTTRVNVRSERINQLNLLSGQLGVGYYKKFSSVTIGFQGGTSLYYVVGVDEKQTQRDGSAQSFSKSNYNPLLVNARISAILKIDVNKSASIVFSPFFESGINATYNNQTDTQSRCRYGLRIGISGN